MIALAFSGGKDSMACLHLRRAELACAIYVDTGMTYPETHAMVAYAATLVPLHVVQSDRLGQNAREGIPADVVPIDWTVLGQTMTCPKPTTLQSYLGCCYENIIAPLWAKAKALGVTHLVFGQRNGETHKSTARDGTVHDGMTRLHPVETWSEGEVLTYLATQMDVPAHYAFQHSSLDCYDCTAYRHESEDRVAWMKDAHPSFYAAYRARMQAVDQALLEAYV